MQASVCFSKIPHKIWNNFLDGLVRGAQLVQAKENATGRV